MKKYLIILALMVSMPLFAEHVDPETARKVATTFLSNNGAKASQLTDLSKSAGFQNLYIFNAEQGFVVMAADDCVKPILGYSLTGKFETEDMPENVSSWLQGYSDGIQHAIDNGINSTASIRQAWKDLANSKAGASEATPIVDALLQTRWDQGSPYNNQCPKKGSTRTVTGCVATAMAQVMKFWNHPATGTGSHSYTWNGTDLSAVFGTTTYDWSNMTDTYGSSSTTPEKTAVATLMYHCGVSVEMKYNTSGNGGSSASTYDVMSALQTYFSYAPVMQYKSKDDYGDEVWITMLKRELNQGRPMQYKGSDAGGKGGHSFVCDGYDSNDNFHFNWGWGGYCDGFYSVNDMEPGTGGIGAGNGVYTVGESAIFGIEPLSSLTAPVISASTDQGVVTLTWDPVTGADSYDVYKDNEKVCDGITGTTYVDTEIEFGVTYDYYLRAVYSNERSNPSNHVSLKSLYRDIKPSNLTAVVDNNNVEFSWAGYSGGLSTNLHYGTGDNYYLPCTGPIYWGQKYVANSFSNFAGMCINRLTFKMMDAGNYTVYLYKTNTTDASNQLLQQNFTVTQEGWVNININNPIPIDISEDLWIVFYSDASEIRLSIDMYEGDNDQLASYYNSSLETLADNLFEAGTSWPIKIQITDGTCTYNLYDGNTKVNDSPIPTANYTLENIGNGVHQFTVKTNFSGSESEASNVMGITIGANTLATLNLSADNRMTVTKNSTLTVSGDLINNNPANLILEDGAQLITSSDDVAATIKKNINDWGTTNWYFIASPISTAITPTGLITDELGSTATSATATYDLYSLDITQENAWQNYRQHTFDLTNGMGYLYASKEGTTLSFSGTIQPSDENITVNNLNEGFNLVGNPYTCTAYVNQPHYTLDQASDGITGNTTAMPMKTPIATCTGVIVESTSNGSVIFSKDVPSSSANQGDIQMTLSQQVNTRSGSNMKAIDNAIVSFNEGNQLHKFYFGSQNANIYIPQNNEEYAIVSADAQGSMPVNFKANSNGSYTLSVETENVDLHYLHLIDNLTGADIDLLTTPSYEFEAKTDDYTSRFRILFDAQSNSDDHNYFAFISDGRLIIGFVGEASLEVMDMTGRTVLRKENVHTISTDEMVPGVYVLRLITENKTQTQKIIIK
jgi:hypothetical protein